MRARETERRKIVLFERLVADLAVPALAVRHREAEPVARIVARQPFGVGLLVPRCCLDAAVVAQARVEVAEVHARERVVDAGIGIAARHDDADARLLEYVHGHAADEEIDGVGAGGRVLTHAEDADAQGARAAGELRPGIERQRLAVVVEPDAAREERDAALRLEPPELEDVRVLQEECALLGEEEVEPGQVDLPRVGGGAGEIRVERECRGQRRRDLPESIQRGLEELVLLVRDVVTRRARAQAGDHVDAVALLKSGEARHEPRAREILAAIVRDPAELLAVGPVPAREVDAPGVARRIEGQRLQRDDGLGGPAFRVLAGGGVPDALPVPVLAIGVGVDRLAPHAVRIDVKRVTGAALVERVERHRETVLAEGHVLLVEDFGDDRLGPGVPEARREIQVVVVERNIDARALGGSAVLVRHHDVQVLDERRLLPHGVVEPAVEDRWLLRTVRGHGLAGRVVGHRRRSGEA